MMPPSNLRLGSGGARVYLRQLCSVSVGSHADASLISALSEQLPHIELSSNRYELRRHGKGESYHPVRPPQVIAMPRRT